MATHVKVIAVLYIVFGVFWIVGAFFSTLVLGLIAGFLGMSEEPNAELGSAVLGLTGVMLSAALLAIGIPQVVCGWGLLKFRAWARILGIVIAAISLLNVPVGTVLGIYALYIFFRKDTERLFETPALTVP